MSLSRTSRRAYHHVREAARTVDGAIHKAAMTYSLLRPLINQAYDTRILDSSLMDSYRKYQQARSVGTKIDDIVKA
jgi:hypothetical protein